MEETPTLALSLRAPWAELVMDGRKTREWRGVATRVRARIWIYSSLGRYSKQEEADIAAEFGLDIDALPRGYLVGTVEVTGCEQLEDGSYAWSLARPERAAKLMRPTRKPQPVFFYPF